MTITEQIPTYSVSAICEPDRDEPENVAMFRMLASSMADTYRQKNSDYGDSFAVSVRKYGLVSALTRISDKFNRMENLILNGDRRVNDESLSDTLLDLAAYSIMTIMAIQQQNRR